MKQDIEYFVKVLTAFALLQAITIFIVGLSKGLDPIVVFVNGFVIIMIGNIPQGLPTTVTACLFIVADNMGKYRSNDVTVMLVMVMMMKEMIMMMVMMMIMKEMILKMMMMMMMVYCR